MLVLNATFEPINVCTVRRATVLLLKSKAEVIEIGSRDLHWATGSLPRPVVIRLVTYVRIPRDTHKRKITRRAVFARDGWECQYCGARTSLTVDHVIPRSKGGGSGWDNIVASCAPCNRRKGDRLPHQIDMHPRQKPRTPSAHIFIQLASPTIPATWKQYLLHEARLSRAAWRRRGRPRSERPEGAVSTHGALGTSCWTLPASAGLTAGGTSSSTAAGGVSVWIPLARAQLRSL